MPFYDVGDKKNKEIFFGEGDVLVSSGWMDDDIEHGVLILRPQEPRPIGEYIEHEPHEQVDKGEAPVRMIFKKIESVDVMIERLEKVKEYMTENAKKNI